MKEPKRVARTIVVKVRVRPDELGALKRRFPRGISTAMRRLALGQKLTDPTETQVPRIARGHLQENYRRWTELFSWTANMVADLHRTICRGDRPVTDDDRAAATTALVRLPEIFEAILEEFRSAR